MTTTKKTKRVRDEGKYEYAWLLFTQQVNQAEIAKKAGVAERTLSRWIAENDWVSRRAAANVTRDELVNKTLSVINTLLEKAIAEGKDENSDKAARLADQLSKLAGAIRNLDKQANVVDIVQVFMTFNRWLINRQTIDDQLTDCIIKTVNSYQDMFVSERINHQRPC